MARKQKDDKDAEIRELKAQVKSLEIEVRQLKSGRGKPDEKDIVKILACKGHAVSSGSKRAWTELWRDVIYPHRKEGLAQKEMALLCEEMGHPWGREPIRRAVKVLMEHELLVKKRTHYIPNLAHLEEICR